SGAYDALKRRGALSVLSDHRLQISVRPGREARGRAARIESLEERLGLLTLTPRKVGEEQAVQRHIERAVRRDLLQATLEAFLRRCQVPHLETVPPDQRQGLGQDLRPGAHFLRRESLLEKHRARLKELHLLIGDADLPKRLQVVAICSDSRLPRPDFREVAGHGLEESQILIRLAEPLPPREL